MTGTIYTTYLSQIQIFSKENPDIVDNSEKIWIANSNKLARVLDKEGIIHDKVLAPPWYLVKQVKDGSISREEFMHEYNNYLTTIEERLNYYEDILDKGKNVFFICYEKDRYSCHRSQLGEEFERRGYQVVECTI